jgi:hypothetical protein
LAAFHAAVEQAREQYAARGRACVCWQCGQSLVEFMPHQFTFREFVVSRVK